ncbi:hypothetical protein WA158_003115 [Blastocystis sp. Blastoise]
MNQGNFGYAYPQFSGVPQVPGGYGVMQIPGGVPNYPQNNNMIPGQVPMIPTYPNMNGMAPALPQKPVGPTQNQNIVGSQPVTPVMPIQKEVNPEDVPNIRLQNVPEDISLCRVVVDPSIDSSSSNSMDIPTYSTIPVFTYDFTREEKWLKEHAME